MRKSLFIALSLIAAPALAQPAPNMQQAVDAASAQACASIMNMRGQIISDQSDATTLRQQIAALQQRLADMAKPAVAPSVVVTPPLNGGGASIPAAAAPPTKAE